jgi:hypothetical protein
VGIYYVLVECDIGKFVWKKSTENYLPEGVNVCTFSRGDSIQKTANFIQ